MAFGSRGAQISASPPLFLTDNNILVVDINKVPADIPLQEYFKQISDEVSTLLASRKLSEEVAKYELTQDYGESNKTNL